MLVVIINIVEVLVTNGNSNREKAITIIITVILMSYGRSCTEKRKPWE